MQISTQMSYAGGFKESAAQVARMEKAGLDLVWVAEAYGFDAPSLMGYLAASTETVQIASGILPIYTRTPTLLAMTAAGIDALSGGRCQLGLGASGPAGDRGLARRHLRHARSVAPGRSSRSAGRCGPARTASVHDGKRYTLPLPAGQGTGLGKPLKIIAHPVRPRIPIWVASLGPKNVEMTAEVADGWMPLFYLPEKAKEVWGADLDAGLAKRDPTLGPLQMTAGGIVAIGEDVARASATWPDRWSRSTSAAWAPRARTSTTTSSCATATRRRPRRSRTSTSTARRTRPPRSCPMSSWRRRRSCGPEGYVKERLAAYKEAGVTHLNVTPDPAGDQSGRASSRRSRPGRTERHCSCDECGVT